MACRRPRSWPVIAAILGLSAVASVPMAQAAPMQDGATVSGGVVPQSGNCPAGRQQDEHCLPGGAGSQTRPVGPVLPPVTPPITPPVGPLTLPPGIPPEEQSKFIFGLAKATLHT